jgi:chemotaxis protein MotA
MDLATILGLLFGFGCAIIVGPMLEGLHLSSIIQPTAALIVFGGTLGATMLGASMSDVVRAAKAFASAISARASEKPALIDRIVEMASLARRDGLLALEPKLESEENPFLKKALRYLVDGLEPATIRGILEEEIDIRERQDTAAAKVYEAAGGYAPTVGILGAVLGLIHVMQQLDDPSKLGGGIAVAFVATVYGVGSANLLFLPLANKLKARCAAKSRTDSMILDGVLGIIEGLNHHLLRERLSVYLLEDGARPVEKPADVKAA